MSSVIMYPLRKRPTCGQARGGRSAPRPKARGRPDGRRRGPGLALHNTLTRRKDAFVSLEPGRVKMYSCGPTVYRYAHIGNLRAYLVADWLRRLLEAHGYRVRHVKNITDVGHMRQEMLERGEDKAIAAALAEGKTPTEIARVYTDALRPEATRPR